MLTSIPQARLVRKGGQHFTPPPAPPSDELSVGRVVTAELRGLVRVAIGLWPLTSVVLLLLGLLYMAGMNGSP